MPRQLTDDVVDADVREPDLDDLDDSRTFEAFISIATIRVAAENAKRWAA